MKESASQKLHLVILRSDVTFKKWAKSYESHQLASPEFFEKFRFYSKRRRFHTGLVISKEGFEFWMNNCGLFNDTFNQAEMKQQFIDAAGGKVVMGVHDCIRFLMKACLGRLHITDVIKRLENAPSLETIEKILAKKEKQSLMNYKKNQVDNKELPSLEANHKRDHLKNQAPDCTVTDSKDDVSVSQETYYTMADTTNQFDNQNLKSLSCIVE